VDFILEDGQKITPVEVKYSALTKPEIMRSLRSFCEKYEPAEAMVVNLHLHDELLIGKTKVIFRSFWELM
jgi:hypothetical protein